jgi:hypothetical protein
MTWLQELAQAQRSLRDGGWGNKVHEMTYRAYAARTPEEAHAIIQEYVYTGTPAEETGPPMPWPITEIDSDRRAS